MTLERRQFMGWAGAALVGSGCAKGGGATPGPAPRGTAQLAASNQDKWARIRAEFDQDPAYLNFTGFLLTPHPRRVREAIAAHRDALDKNPALVLEKQLELSVTGKDNFDT